MDAARDGQVKVESLPAADLPPEMQKMTPAERRAHVEQKAKERADVQKKIAELSQARATFLAKEQAKRARGSTDTLDSAMIKSVRAQAAKSRYTFE